MDFSFFLLLRYLKEKAEVQFPLGKEVSSKAFEDLIENLCRRQDDDLIRHENKYPDIVLSNNQGVEAKLLTDRPNKSVNLNSTCPSETYYVFGYHDGERLAQAAIVHGRNYYSPEMQEIQDGGRGTTVARNPMLKYRTRLMWEVESPFKIYGEGFFLVDHAGGLIKV